MKVTRSNLKGVGLLLLSLAAMGEGRNFAADIASQNFLAMADSPSASAAGSATASPFKDESASTLAKSVTGETTTATALPPTGTAPAYDCFLGAPGKVWFRGEYVHWWTSGANMPAMVETLTNNGTIAQPIFGDRTVYDGNHDGYRMNFGMWLDCQHCWGVEADYMDLSGKPCGYVNNFTDGFVNGNPYSVLRVLSNPNEGGQVIDYIGDAGNKIVGNISIDSSNYFQSAGITVRHELRAMEWSTCNRDVNWTDSSARTFRLDALAGYRFARLIDTVNETDNSFDYNTNSAFYEYSYNTVNNYKTVNNFNGAELGLNAVYTFGRWSLDVVGKAAIGVNNQYASVYNQVTVDVSNAIGPTPPLVGNPSPLQEFSRNQFSAIPELMVTGGYQVTDHFKVTVGYDLLYWSAVVRAPNQIAVDPSSGALYGTATGNFSGNLPQLLSSAVFNETHYFAEGLRLGAELRF